MNRNTLIALVVGAIVGVGAVVGIYNLTGQQQPPIFPVEIVSWEVDDTVGGNGDGRLNPGETVKIRYFLANTGTDPIPPSNPTLSTSQSWVTITPTENTANFPGIGVGDTVGSIDTFEFSVATSVTAPNAVFILTATQSPDIMYQAAAAVPIFYDYYACLDSYQILEGGANDTVVIRLSICNDNGNVLSSSAAHITAASVHNCGTNVSFTAATNGAIVLDKVLFNSTGDPTIFDISADTCADPAQVSPSMEFRFVSNANLTGICCIYFIVDIYSNATISAVGNIIVNPLNKKKSIELGFRHLVE
jgi:hypothetical protein